jgi:hypothetical protein
VSGERETTCYPISQCRRRVAVDVH